MNTWQRWLQAPQTHWLRRALFQVHLWAGVGLGLYVLVIGLSGSGMLLRSPFYSWFEPKHIEALDTEPLKGAALNARMAEVYEGYELGFTIEAYQPGDATYVVLKRDGEFIPHYFNQFTGEDVGPARPWPILAIEWLADVHDDLLLGPQGRKINGAAALLLVLMSLSGLVLWWQGRARWYEGLIIRPKGGRPLLWQLHSSAGFWSLLLIFAWGMSGFQLGFPQIMNDIAQWFGAEPQQFRGPGAGSGVMQFFRDVHFARFGQGTWVRWIWITLSFVPALMFVTGVWLWCRRVVFKPRKKTLPHG